MIDFRYHVVSLIAVFLALALGILVGTTQLNGAVLDNLRGEVKGLTADKRTLQQDNRDLQQQVKNDDSVTQSVAPIVVDEKLRGTQVVIVSTAQADRGVKEDVQRILEQSDATVTGRIQLLDDYSDPRRSGDIKALANSAQPAGFTLPVSEDAGVLAGALLAHVLVRKPGEAAPEQAAVTQVLSGFTSQGILRVESGQVTVADQVVVVSSETVTGDNAEQRMRMVTSLVNALDEGGRGTVVAGTEKSAEGGGLVQAVRNDSGLSDAVSTVDDADRPGGQIALVLALVQQATGKSGQYGSAGKASAPFPPTSTS